MKRRCIKKAIKHILPHDLALNLRHPIDGYHWYVITVWNDTIESCVHFHKKGISLCENSIPYLYIPYREMVKAIPDYTYEKM